MEVSLDSIMGKLRKIPYFPSIQTKTKYLVVDVSLTVIGTAFEEVSKSVTELKSEIYDWNDGRRAAIGVLPKGPYITLEKRGDQIHYLGKGLKSPDVTFFFKNLDSAFLVFTAQMSAHQAASECRVLVDGNNAYAMELNRALSIVETYLFPSLILNMLFKRPPKLDMDQQILKGKIGLSLVPALIKKIV
ncbi:MAG: hypothetical protein HQK79_11475 [Desulfobacterales bacterium]|nr:hypothetical protein [Desulfobacterales bacterium]MBF0396223.1 hypothetical protein [Desulfobacterales bacterium]